MSKQSFMHPSAIKNRRQFLGAVTVGGLSLGVSAMIPSASLFAKELPAATWQADNMQITTYMDEALGNYPGYSETVGYGREHFFADEAVDSDPHFML